MTLYQLYRDTPAIGFPITMLAGLALRLFSLRAQRAKAEIIRSANFMFNAFPVALLGAAITPLAAFMAFVPVCFAVYYSNKASKLHGFDLDRQR